MPGNQETMAWPSRGLDAGEVMPASPSGKRTTLSMKAAGLPTKVGRMDGHHDGDQAAEKEQPRSPAPLAVAVGGHQQGQEGQGPGRGLHGGGDAEHDPGGQGSSSL